jgi:hypothetical protein
MGNRPEVLIRKMEQEEEEEEEEEEEIRSSVCAERPPFISHQGYTRV